MTLTNPLKPDANGMIRCSPEDGTNGFFVSCFIRSNSVTSRLKRRIPTDSRQDEAPLLHTPGDDVPSVACEERKRRKRKRSRKSKEETEGTLSAEEWGGIVEG